MDPDMSKVVQLLKMMKGFKKLHEVFLRDIGVKFELTGAQLDLLWIISHRNGLTVTEISDLGLLHISTAMHLISALEKKGLAKKQNSNKDKRTWHVFITDTGQNIIKEVLDTHDTNKNVILQATKKVAQDMDLPEDQFIEFGMRLVKELHGDDYYKWVTHNAKQVTGQLL